MSNERNGYRTALVLFAVAVIIAILMAFATTLERAGQRMAKRDRARYDGSRQGSPAIGSRARTARVRRMRAISGRMMPACTVGPDILATHCADAEVCASSGEAARLCSKTLDAEDL
jgi:hypothetical protein